MAVNDANLKRQNRLHVYDRITGMKFLVDTGAEISVLPPVYPNAREVTQLTLFAANNSVIDTYGERRLKLDLGLRRDIEWVFCVAAVPFAIIGADLLTHYGLMVDLKGRRLYDRTTGLTSKGQVQPAPTMKISTVQQTLQFTNIFSEFPEIIGVRSRLPISNSSVFHVIETTGPPVAERPRRLPPDKLEAAKKEFMYMMEQGICRPSKSQWASPLHLVTKKSGEWRPCGDYRRLNAVTIPDRYPVPDLQDFAHNIHGKRVFSTLDLQRAFHQIPVAPKHISKSCNNSFWSVRILLHDIWPT